MAKISAHSAAHHPAQSLTLSFSNMVSKSACMHDRHTEAKYQSDQRVTISVFYVSKESAH